jgi:tetratricopeptide (TPR) repeat protein
MVPGPGRQYKIKLKSGRILGPLDMARVRALVRKNHVTGAETAREHPDGEWQDINLIPELAELFIAKAEGRLDSERTQFGIAVEPQPLIHQGPTQVLSEIPEIPQGETVVIPSDPPVAGLAEPGEQSAPPPAAALEADPTAISLGMAQSVFEPEMPEQPPQKSERIPSPEDAEPTRIEDLGRMGDTDAANEIRNAQAVELQKERSQASVRMTRSVALPAARNIATEKTIVLQRSGTLATGSLGSGKKRPSRAFQLIKSLAMIAAVVLMMQEILFENDGPKPMTKPQIVRPRLPASEGRAADPMLSKKLHAEALKHYFEDTVEGYRTAAGLLLKATAADMNNVQALAMLASSYINLIDASNKDENYFSVISKLIDMSRAKNVDLDETVIADVEFYITANRAEAAQNRIVEYTKTHRNFSLAMFYYLAYAFYMRGDIESAARYIAEFPENKVYTPRIFWLRGQIAERSSIDEALTEYRKAIKFSKSHARSRLRIAYLLSRQGKLKEAARDLEFLTTNQKLLTPKELAQAYYLHAQLFELFQKWDLALGDVERCVVLDRDNHDYLLELYSLRARLGDRSVDLKKEAKMYFYLGEGERLVKQGKHHEALTQFLEARQANLDSPLPLVKAGDMFYYLKDVSNARMNYEMATKHAPKSVEVWSKYIDTLIQSYDWEAAQKAIENFRSLTSTASMIDKLAGDMYAKQGRHDMAQLYYRKAMGRDLIDPKVYISYANSLAATRNYKDAPFFYALALRYDPLNTQAIIGNAKCVAGAESIDRAISMLQDELQREASSKAELLSAVAELQIQKGEPELAQRTIDQAMAANPELADPWKLQAQLYLSRENTDRKALDHALAAYKSYSDRNASDPSGYLERYRVFVKKTQYEAAAQELERIYAVYPKYPNLHFYKGALYAIMGNHKESISEFNVELTNNPGNVTTLIGLGKELIEVGAFKEAMDQFNKAMMAAPMAAEPKHMSAYANYLLKNYSGAVALYQAALAVDPANPLIYKRLGMAYRAMGDLVGARAAFRKYLEMEPDAVDKAEFERIL